MQVLKLLGRRERWLAVAGIRFLRTCLAMKDEFYNRYVVSWPLPWCRKHALLPSCLPSSFATSCVTWPLRGMVPQPQSSCWADIRCLAARDVLRDRPGQACLPRFNPAKRTHQLHRIPDLFS